MVLDPSTQLIYAADINNAIIHTFNYAGVELSPLNITTADAALIAPAEAFYVFTLLPAPLGEPSLLVPSAGGSALYAISTVTGRVRPFLTFSGLCDGVDLLTDCVVNEPLGLIYCVDYRFSFTYYDSYYYYEFSESAFLPAFVADLRTGQILAEFVNFTDLAFSGLEGSLAGAITVDAQGAVWTGTVEGLVSYSALPSALLPSNVTASASLCVLLYSLPGNVDYPWSVALSVSFQYSPTPITTASGTAVAVLSASGTRTYTNRFGVATTTQLSLLPLTSACTAPSTDNLLYLNSSLPFDALGLTWALSSPIQLPGVGPSGLTSQLTLSSQSGVVAESSESRVDGLGSAFLSSLPGFLNVTIGASNVNSLAALYPTCTAPITCQSTHLTTH